MSALPRDFGALLLLLSGVEVAVVLSDVSDFKVGFAGAALGAAGFTSADFDFVDGGGPPFRDRRYEA
jgi:F420-0:gamma-glutamyl ligase